MSSQQAATGVGSGRGDYETPDDLFAMLDLRVGGFTLDAAASHENTKVPALYCTAEGTFEYAHGEHFFRDSATGLTYRLLPLTDEEKYLALAAHARARGFALSDEVAAYLLTHARRDMPSLIQALDALDRYSLETGRPITVPLLKAALQPELT